MNTVARTPASRAAQATACPWFPALAATLAGVTVAYVRRKADQLPPHWVSIELADDGLHVAVRSANYPTAGDPPVPTGVQTAVDNLWAWDTFASAGRHDACWVLVLSSPMAGTRYVAVPHSAFSPADDVAVGAALAARGLLSEGPAPVYGA